MLVFLLGLCFPLLDGGQAFDSSAFVSHDGIIGKAPSQGFRIMPVLGDGTRPPAALPTSATSSFAGNWNKGLPQKRAFHS